jgi:hypothetical protein
MSTPFAKFFREILKNFFSTKDLLDASGARAEHATVKEEKKREH